MELENLDGNIVGIISDDFKEDSYCGKSVRDIVVNKVSASLKMVGLNEIVLDCMFDDLGDATKAKVILASKLNDKNIILNNFSKGLVKKEIDFFKKLFKKITKYDRRIFLIDKNSYMFLDNVDNIYVINKKKVVFETDDMFDKGLEEFIDMPKIVKFILDAEDFGVTLNHYREMDELLKAIYRIKS